MLAPFQRRCLGILFARRSQRRSDPSAFCSCRRLPDSVSGVF